MIKAASNSISSSIYKPFWFWARTESGKRQPRRARMQLDTATDRTILSRLPAGAQIKGESVVNGQPVHVVEIIAHIPNTECIALIDAAVPKEPGTLPAVIGADFFQKAQAIIDYNGELIGCPAGRRRKIGFAGAARHGVYRTTR